MKRNCAFVATLTIAVFAGSSIVAAQSVPLFNMLIPDGGSGSPLPGTFAIHEVLVNFDALELAPTWLDIELPGVGTVTATLESFETIEGYDEAGIPLPGKTTADFVYNWQGKSDDFWTVNLAVVYGEISGLAIGPGGSFTIQEFSNVDYLVEVDVDYLPTEELPSPAAVISAGKVGPRPKLRVVPTYVPPPHKESLLPEYQRLRVLFLYTEQARIDAEGSSLGGDPDDHNIRAHVQGSVMDANCALTNSKIEARVETAAITLLEGFEPTGEPDVDLRTLQEDQAIATLRDAVAADVVSVVLRNGEKGGLVPVCGWSIPQRPTCTDPGKTPIEGCAPGPDFAPFAYHYTSVSCRASLVFPHELGHTLSAEHNFEDAVARNEATYTFAFGHYENLLFGTMMSYRPSVSLRILYYSSPYLLHPELGVPLGEIGLSDNVRAIEHALPIAVGFRGDPSGLLFIDDFEGGTTELWDEEILAFVSPGSARENREETFRVLLPFDLTRISNRPLRAPAEA